MILKDTFWTKIQNSQPLKLIDTLWYWRKRVHHPRNDCGQIFFSSEQKNQTFLKYPFLQVEPERKRDFERRFDIKLWFRGLNRQPIVSNIQQNYSKTMFYNYVAFYFE